MADRSECYMSWLKRGPSKMERLQGASRLQEAIGRAEEAAAAVQAEPPSIYNPVNGTCYHYLDPDQAATKPVCKASGAGWAEGSGGLKRCGLCPHMWAQRQAGSDETRAAS
jgi:hypothetical protein